MTHRELMQQVVSKKRGRAGQVRYRKWFWAKRGPDDTVWLMVEEASTTHPFAVLYPDESMLINTFGWHTQMTARRLHELGVHTRLRKGVLHVIHKGYTWPVGDRFIVLPSSTRVPAWVEHIHDTAITRQALAVPPDKAKFAEIIGLRNHVTRVTAKVREYFQGVREFHTLTDAECMTVQKCDAREVANRIISLGDRHETGY